MATDLADRIRSEAETASRSGQMGRLDDIAAEVDELVARADAAEAKLRRHEAEPRPRTYYTTMLKERHRAERAEEHAAAFKRRWAEERTRAEAAEAEARALRDVVRRHVYGWHVMRDIAGDWWAHPLLDDNPSDRVTPAEAAAIRAATPSEGDADPTPPRTNPLQTQWTRPAAPAPPPETP